MGDLVGVGVEELRDTTLAEFGMEDLDMALRRIGIDIGGRGEASRKVEEEGDGQEEEEEAEEDRFSVISAELFVDPLMNCFHQQKVPEENGKKVREEEGRGGGGEEEGRMMSNGREEGKTEGEQLTPPGSRGGGGARTPRKEEEAKGQRRAGPEAEHKKMPTGGMGRIRAGMGLVRSSASAGPDNSRIQPTPARLSGSTQLCSLPNAFCWWVMESCGMTRKCEYRTKYWPWT